MSDEQQQQQQQKQPTDSNITPYKPSYRPKVATPTVVREFPHSSATTLLLPSYSIFHTTPYDPLHLRSLLLSGMLRNAGVHDTMKSSLGKTLASHLTYLLLVQQPSSAPHTSNPHLREAHDFSIAPVPPTTLPSSPLVLECTPHRNLSKPEHRTIRTLLPITPTPFFPPNLLFPLTPYCLTPGTSLNLLYPHYTHTLLLTPHLLLAHLPLIETYLTSLAAPIKTSTVASQISKNMGGDSKGYVKERSVWRQREACGDNARSHQTRRECCEFMRLESQTSEPSRSFTLTSMVPSHLPSLTLASLADTGTRPSH